MTLEAIYQKYLHICDKGTRHSYIGLYERLLAKYRQNPVTLIEIGVLHGGSLALWADYFTHRQTTIIGVDIHDRSQNVRAVTRDDRVQCRTANTANAHDLASLPTPDIVIDDGSHRLVDQTAAFHGLWPRVRANGLYVIEDIQSDINRDILLTQYPFDVYDGRPTTGRYDDIALVAYKRRQ